MTPTTGIEGVEDNKRKSLCALHCLFLMLCGLIGLTGCATNELTKFYQDKAGAALTNLPPYSGSTRIYTASNQTNDVKDLYRNGYGLIGVSAFRSTPQSDSALKSQAKKVGADVVLFSSAYLGSDQSVVPWTQYNPGQTYTTTSSGMVNANIYGAGGPAYATGNYYGTATTSTPGTYSTQLIPVTRHWYQYEAGFFRKLKPSILGVLPQPLPPEVRQHLERNTGAFVWIVRNGSPAFNSSVLQGDVMLRMNGEDVMSATDLMDKNAKFAGQKVNLEIWRNGQLKTISLQLNPKP